MATAKNDDQAAADKAARDKEIADRAAANAADNAAEGDLGASQVQAASDEASEKGYFGEVPDETPNENYTLPGVAAGKPTPETDRELKAQHAGGVDRSKS